MSESASVPMMITRTPGAGEVVAVSERASEPVTSHANTERQRGDRVNALRVALLGCGVVGTQVVRLLTENAPDLAARVGAPLELAGDPVLPGFRIPVADLFPPPDEPTA